jgi:hypothetical protein
MLLLRGHGLDLRSGLELSRVKKCLPEVTVTVNRPPT